MGEELIGRKVIRGNNSDENPVQGKVVSVNASSSTVWVLWPDKRDPEGLRFPALMLVPSDKFNKRFKWAGKTFGELKEFVAQAEAEGATNDTRLNDSTAHRVHIEVSLPLATKATVVHKHGPADPHIPGERA